jgi:hypothetical protein
MTREEAIQALKKEKKTALHENKVAFDMAIKALEQEPCEDAVSRKAIDLLCFEFLRANSDDNCAFYERFRDLPPVTPTRKVGKWIEIKNKKGAVIALRCDCCEKSPKHAIRSLWCPNCGADMRGGEE